LQRESIGKNRPRCGSLALSHLGLDALAGLPVVSPPPPNIVATEVVQSLQLARLADHAGWRLEAQANTLSAGLGTNWTTVAG
jgi:hypothetical protein